MNERQIFNSVASAAPAIRRVVDGSRRILLHLHPSPDSDSVGSALACYHLFRSWGKVATVIGGDSPLPQTLLAVPGAERVMPVAWSGINPADYDLFLILDSATARMITRSNHPLTFPPGLRTIAIDHHRSHQPYAELTLLVPDAPATAAVLYELFQIWKIDWRPEIAAGLLAGLYSDTGGFRYPLTTGATLEAAAALGRFYPEFPSLWSALQALSPAEINFERLALNHLETWCAGRVAAIFLDHGAIAAAQIPEAAIGAGGLAAHLANVTDWPVTVVAVEDLPRQIRISIRGRGEGYDVAQAMALFGGGGHRAAAGAFVTDRALAEVKQILQATITRLWFS